MTGSDRLKARKDELELNKIAQRGVERFVDQLPAGVLGAADEALFGIPEYVAKQFDREGVEKFKRENEGYGVGEVVGTIGSAFVPVGGIVGKGLQGASKLAGASKVASVLDKAGKFMSGVDTSAKFGRSVAQAAGRGAIEAGLEGAIRAGANERDVLSEAGQSALAGGLFGAGAQVVGKGVESISELAKKTGGSVLSSAGVNKRDLYRMLDKFTGAGSDATKVTRAQDAIDEVTNLIRRNPDLKYAIGKDDIIKDLLEKFKSEVRPIFDAARKDPAIIENALRNATDNIPEIAAVAGKPETFVNEQIVKMVDELTKSGSSVESQRNAINQIINRSKDGSKAADVVRFNAGIAMKQNLDKALEDVAEKIGGKSLKDIMKDYKAIQTISSSELRNMATVAPTSSGSSTMEKAVVYSVLGGGGAAMNSEDEDKVRNALIGAMVSGVAGTALSKFAQKASNQGTATLDTLLTAITNSPNASQIANKLGKKIEPVLRAVGRAGVPIAKSIDEASEGLNKRSQDERDYDKIVGSEPIPAVESVDGEDQEEKPKRDEYRDLVVNKLYQRFATKYPQLASDKASFVKFVESAERASNGFDPRRTAKLIFPREEDRKAFLAALSTKKSVDESLPNIGDKDQGFFGIGAKPLETGQMGARATLEGAFLEAAKLANVDSKSAKGILGQIIDSKDMSLDEKKQAILEQTRNWNQTGFEALANAGLEV